FVTGRYRHHLTPALAPLAGVALAALPGALRDPGKRARAVVALAAGLALVFAPLAVEGRSARTGGWALTVDRGLRLRDLGRYEEAGREFARAETALGGAPVAARLSGGERVNLAAFYFRYGIALAGLDRNAEAIEKWERAVQLNPNDAGSLGRLALALEA